MTKSAYGKSSTKRIVMIALFTALISIGAFVRIDTPAMSFTLQFLFVLIAGFILGEKDSVICIVIYIVLGLIGLPVFARGGGIAYVLQPSFGYILSFVPAAYICGKMTKKGKAREKEFQTMLVASLVALTAVYMIGTVYYWAMSTFYLGANIGAKSIFLYCILLVLPGDFLSCFIGAIVSKRIKIILQ